MRKQGTCLEKEIMQGRMQGARRRGRPRTAWMDNIKTWTGLPVEESVRMTEDRDKWRKYVHGVANPRIEDGYRTEQQSQNWLLASTIWPPLWGLRQEWLPVSHVRLLRCCRIIVRFVVLLGTPGVEVMFRIWKDHFSESPFTKAVFTSDELNWTNLHQVDPVTRRIIGHARQRHEVDWLLGCSLQCAHCSSIQFSSCAVNTA